MAGLGQRLGGRPHDIGKAKPAGKEARDRNLVGGVEDDGRRAARFERLAREPERRKPRYIGYFEVEFPIAARSSRCAGVAIRSGHASA